MWAWLLVLVVALAPVLARASVATFQQYQQLDGSLGGATMGAGQGYASATDWTAITFLDGTDCGSNCANGKSVMLQVDTNLGSNSFGLGGIAFNFTAAGLTPASLTINKSCTGPGGCSGPPGTPSNTTDNAQTLPNAAATWAKTQNFDVGISWSNAAGSAQTFAGRNTSIFIISASSAISVGNFTGTTNGARQHAVASIVRCTTNCGASGTVVTTAFDVPEPASLAVLGVGLVGVGWVARRR